MQAYASKVFREGTVSVSRSGAGSPAGTLSSGDGARGPSLRASVSSLNPFADEDALETRITNEAPEDNPLPFNPFADALGIAQ